MPRLSFNAHHSVESLRRAFETPVAHADAGDTAPECSALGTLTLQQQVALLRMRHAATADDILARLRKLPDYVEPNGGLYYQLATEGYCIKAPGKSWHILTPRGRRRADDISRHWARHFGLHHFRTISSRYDITVYCACGQFSHHHSKNQGHADFALDAMMARHLQEVSAASPQAADRAAGSCAPRKGPTPEPAAQLIGGRDQ